MSFLDLHPTTILAVIFLVLLMKQSVAAVGKSKIVDHVWSGYAWVASKSGHAKFQQLALKRRELAVINRERKAISAQDQYARWTKLNRAFDKVSSEVDALVESVSSEKAQISKLVGLAITVATAVPLWFSRVWYRKTVLLYFPAGVLPYSLEWCLALPFTKTGGLGLTIWMLAVNSMLSSVTYVVKYLVEPVVEKPVVEAGKLKPASQRASATPELVSS